MRYKLQLIVLSSRLKIYIAITMLRQWRSWFRQFCCKYTRLYL